MPKEPTPKERLRDARPDSLKTANLDLDADAWPKFEALVKSAAKMGHKPHAKSAKPRKMKR
jgi:hypothetical protein